MIALDTNLIVRIVTRDDEAQAKKAVEALRGQPTFVAKTVLLECEWVLRYSYGLDRASIQRALRTLLGLEELLCEDRTAVLIALDWHAKGMNFADALHLASCPENATLFTFDQKLATKANELGLPSVRGL